MMRKISLTVLLFSLFLSEVVAKKDYYMIERKATMDVFVKSCFDNTPKGEYSVNFEAYCRCAWDGITTEFTNAELIEINKQAEPIFSEFMTKMRAAVPTCKAKYITPIADKVR